MSFQIILKFLHINGTKKHGVKRIVMVIDNHYLDKLPYLDKTPMNSTITRVFPNHHL